MRILAATTFTALWTCLWLGIRHIRQVHAEHLTLEAFAVRDESLAILLSALLLFLIGYRFARDFSPKLLLLLHFIAAAILIDTAPLLSSDVYLYIGRGRLLSFYGLSPYEFPVAEIWFDPITDFVFQGWLELLQPYGPVWTTASGIICQLTGADIKHNVLGFKIFGLIGTLLCFFALRTMPVSEPSKLRQCLYLFALNPLILVDSVNNAHNDIWMLCGILFAIRAYQLSRFTLVIPYLILAAMVKVPALILIPVAFVFLLRLPQEVRPSLFRVVLPPLLLSLVLILPYWTEFASLDGLLEVSSLRREYAAFLGTPIVFFAYLWHWTGSLVLGAEESLLFGRCVFISLYGFLLYRSSPTIAQSFETSFFLLLALAASVFLPWYAMWVAVLGAARGDFAMTFWWTAIGLLAYYWGYTSAAVFLLSVPLYLLYRLTYPQTKEKSDPPQHSAVGPLEHIPTKG